MNKIFRCIPSAILAAIMPLVAINSINQYDIWKIAHRGLQKPPQLVTPDLPKPEHTSLFGSTVEFFFGNKYTLAIPQLSKAEKEVYVFTLLAPEKPKSTTENNTVDDHSIIDTDFIITNELLAHHGKDSSTGHLVDCFFKDHDTSLLKTAWGRKQCTEIVTEPTKDLATLHARQAIIKNLLQDEVFAQQVTDLMQQINAYDAAFMFCSTDHPFVKTLINKNNWQFTWWPFTRLNYSPKFAELYIFSIYALPISCIPLAPWCITKLLKGWQPSRELIRSIIAGAIGGMLSQVKIDSYVIPNIIVNNIASTMSNTTGKAIALAGSSAVSTFGTMGTINLNTLHRTLQKIAIDNAQFLGTIQKLFVILEKHNFTELLPTLGNLNLEKNTNKELTELISVLKKNTFSGDPSAFSYMGRAIQAVNLLQSTEVIHALIPALKALGELDTYLAIAHKMKTTDHQNNPYCFATYINDSTAPYIKATNFFNPFLAKPVLNTLEIGTRPDSKDGITTIVVNGPNTGGKSTSINGIMYAALLAQTFGIAPATEFIVTPFDKLISHRNVADNIIAKVSGYQAEVDNVKKMITEIQKVHKTGGYVFVTLDELFRSTTPEQGDNLTTQAVNELTHTYPTTCITMIATHFPSPLGLADINTHIANYQMDTLVHEDGSVKQYTYLLKPGISCVKNAYQIAELNNMLNRRHQK